MASAASERSSLSPCVSSAVQATVCCGLFDRSARAAIPIKGRLRGDLRGDLGAGGLQRGDGLDPNAVDPNAVDHARTKRQRLAVATAW